MAQTTSREPWHAVSIVAGAASCAAVADIRGKRFLAADAPRIPLPECTVSRRCTCTYRHSSDRRTSRRRASDRGMFGKHTGADRREYVDRRRDEGL